VKFDIAVNPKLSSENYDTKMDWYCTQTTIEPGYNVVEGTE